MEGTSLIFITGGVRSGKSSFAEKFAVHAAVQTNGALNYIATGVPSDEEMKRRIQIHRLERDECEFPWQTWEQSGNIGVLAPSFSDHDILLFDCLTTLLNNELFSFKGELNTIGIDEIYHRVLSGITALRKKCRLLIVVSNELLNETFSEDEFMFVYRLLLGKLHREIVIMADQAYLVETGVPVLMKGNIVSSMV